MSFLVLYIWCSSQCLSVLDCTFSRHVKHLAYSIHMYLIIYFVLGWMLQFPYLVFKPSYSVFYNLIYYIGVFSLRFVLNMWGMGLQKENIHWRWQDSSFLCRHFCNPLRFYFQISVCIFFPICFLIKLFFHIRHWLFYFLKLFDCVFRTFFSLIAFNIFMILWNFLSGISSKTFILHC